jgi:hypothetical protein
VAVVNVGRALPATDLELYLSHLLARLGFTVYVLFDDGALEHWDSAQLNDLKYYSPYHAWWYIRWPCAIRKRLMCRAYRIGDFRVLNYSTILRRSAPLAPDENREAAYAVSSTKRFFVTGVVDTDGAHADYYRRTLRNCAVSRTVGAYVRDVVRPDLYVSSHCIYSVWGPAYEEVRAAGIPTLASDVIGNATGRFRLSDQSFQRLSVCSDWREFRRRSRGSPEIERQGAALLDERVNHRVYDVREYYPAGAQTAVTARPEARHGDRTLAMFPNVIWDGDIPERNIMFNNVLEWCTFTVETLRHTPHRLCIRFHPAEDTRHRGSLRLEELLRQRIPDLDRIGNLTLIGSSEKLDTYAFARANADVGLVYDGTLCLELTHLGIPVIACTHGMFTLDGVAYKPTSLGMYRDWLSAPDQVLRRFAIEKAERMACAREYAYWLFEDSLMEFKPIAKPYPVVMDYKLVGPNDVLSSDELRIADRMLRAARSHKAPKRVAA